MFTVERVKVMNRDQWYLYTVGYSRQTHSNAAYKGVSAELQARPGLPHGGAGIIRSEIEGH